MKEKIVKIISTLGITAMVALSGAVPAIAADVSTSAVGDVPPIWGNSTTDLGQLFILDRLFNRNTDIFGNHRTNLGDLFILDQLFGNDTIFDNGGIVMDNNNLFGGGASSLGDLFVLNRLFGGGGQANLGDLFILDQLFR